MNKSGEIYEYWNYSSLNSGQQIVGTFRFMVDRDFNSDLLFLA